MNIDTAFELIDLYQKEIEALSGTRKDTTPHSATQKDIDALLF